jgi:4-alpha-glucanotransferase
MPIDGANRVVADALRALGVRNLVVGIQDPAFPGFAGDDVGRGSPYSRGADAWLRFVRGLGFTGVQLGPQGQTSDSDPSPYDGTIFSRNVLSIALRELTEDGNGTPLLRARTLVALAAGVPSDGSPDRVPYGYAFAAQRKALGEAFARFEQSKPCEIVDRLEKFTRQNASWLERDALYEVLRELHGGHSPRDWKRDAEPHPDRDLWDPAPGQAEAAQIRKTELLREHRHQIEAYSFAQMLVHEQHAALRARCRNLGLELYGDLQIGLSDQDVFSYRSVLLRDYVMGAPPSRTTPEGQPWNYALLDPNQTDLGAVEHGGAMRLLLGRVDKMFDEYDAVRIDHPHGLVCPWVYRAGQPDPLFAVQHGARLHCSPDLPDHPELARFAIVGPAQLRRTVPRYADDWVEALRPEQIDRYAIFFDAMVASARNHGRDARAIVCEILSTLPRPLEAVLKRHGLGRFRVVQKANLDDASDVYRPENARPEDWIMAGNHDTPPIWNLVRAWAGSDKLDRWACHLASRLGLDAKEFAGRPGLLVHAIFADLFASKAENAYVFFTDLFGFDRSYNVPGTVGDENWSLRLSLGFARDYADRVARDHALNLPKALAMAFGGRGPEFRRAHADLIAELERLATAMGR